MCWFWGIVLRLVASSPEVPVLNLRYNIFPCMALKRRLFLLIHRFTTFQCFLLISRLQSRATGGTGLKERLPIFVFCSFRSRLLLFKELIEWFGLKTTRAMLVSSRQIEEGIWMGSGPKSLPAKRCIVSRRLKFIGREGWGHCTTRIVKRFNACRQSLVLKA
jgi:hypothetical protein